MAKRPERSERLQVYLIPSSAKDKVVLDVWKAAKKHVRPQEFFRDILYRAIREAYLKGDIPVEIEKACNLAERLPGPSQSGGGDRSMPPPVPWFAYPPQMAPVASPPVATPPAPAPEAAPAPPPASVPARDTGSAPAALPARPAPAPARQNTRQKFSALMGEG